MDSVFLPVAPSDTEHKHRSKISVIGAGAVGAATAFSLMEIAGEIALVDCNTNKVNGEALDLQHGQQFLRHSQVRGSSDYAITAGSDIVVITAGSRRKETETKFEVASKTTEIFKQIIPKVVQYSPNCVIVVISYPVDIMTYVAAKLSGFPTHKVIGTGTMLDSARFRYLLGEKLGVSANSVHGYIIGELGDNSIPLWSNVNVAGVRLVSINPKIGCADDPEDLGSIHKTVMKSTNELFHLKGCNSWSMGLACHAICNSILHNLHNVYPLSISAKGLYGIQEDVYMSFPCLITSEGVSHVIPQELSSNEDKKLKESAKELNEIIQKLHL